VTIDLGLDGRAALVTGAGMGIGRAIAAWLVQAGCDVALIDRDEACLDETVAELKTHGTLVVAQRADLREDGAANRVVADAARDLDGLDVAVNNVGSLAGRGTSDFVDQDDEYVRDVIEQNLVLTAACCRAEARAMIDQARGGVILNVSSGESTRPALGLAAYGAAKAAINHLTGTLATELGPHGIRVNAVAPGTTLTPTVAAALTDDYVTALTESLPLRRMCEPADLARLVVALASDLGAGVTGQTVLADNGAHLSRNRPAR
jgi:NAD(P)-dependent dehydrogenase (short-subunit alcohol dehydrogenase family)